MNRLFLYHDLAAAPAIQGDYKQRVLRAHKEPSVAVTVEGVRHHEGTLLESRITCIDIRVETMVATDKLRTGITHTKSSTASDTDAYTSKGSRANERRIEWISHPRHNVYTKT